MNKGVAVSNVNKLIGSGTYCGSTVKEAVLYIGVKLLDGRCKSNFKIAEVKCHVSRGSFVLHGNGDIDLASVSSCGNEERNTCRSAPFGGDVNTAGRCFCAYSCCYGESSLVVLACNIGEVVCLWRVC